MPSGTAITIGNFDGVHLGHAALVTRARETMGDTGRVIALVFDPHPLTALRPETAPERLSTFAQRERWLRALGADEVVRLTPDASTLSMTPEQFVQRLVRDYSPAVVVEGADFRFGKGRAGDVRTLESLGRAHGFRVEVVPPVTAELESGAAPVSSSAVRAAVTRGDMAAAALLLGREYELAGMVVCGDRRGRTIGFPTANLATECLLPADGVYAGRATLPDARVVPAAVSVGTKPTFGDSPRVAEAYLIGVEAGPGSAIAGLPEYAWPLRVGIASFLRGQTGFADTQELVRQMKQDCLRVMDLLSPVTVEARKEKGVAAR